MLLEYSCQHFRGGSLVGNHLQTVTVVVNPHLAQVRLNFGRPTVAAVEQASPEVTAGRLLFAQYVTQIQQMLTQQIEGDAKRKDVQTCAAATRESQ